MRRGESEWSGGNEVYCSLSLLLWFIVDATTWCPFCFVVHFLISINYPFYIPQSTLRLFLILSSVSTRTRVAVATRRVSMMSTVRGYARWALEPMVFVHCTVPTVREWAQYTL